MKTAQVPIPGHPGSPEPARFRFRRGQVYDWAVKHMDVVQSRQRAYDEQFEHDESVV